MRPDPRTFRHTSHAPLDKNPSTFRPFDKLRDHKIKAPQAWEPAYPEVR